MATWPRTRSEVPTIPGIDAVEDAADMIFAVDDDGCLLFVNRAAELLTGYSRTELLGRSFVELLEPGAKPETDAEVAIVTRSGGRRWIEVQTWTASGAVWGIARDVTRRRAELDELRRQALHDPLTGLPNRTLLHDRLEQSLRLARRKSRPAAVLLVDLDGFKRVNDEHGHARGDDVLRAVGSRIRGALRESDTVARLGGDEFAVLLPEGDAVEAGSVAMKIRDSVREPIILGGVRVRVDASVGYAVFPEDGEDLSTLLAVADGQMYRDKRTRGRRGVSSRHASLVPDRRPSRPYRRRTAACLAVALFLSVVLGGGVSEVLPGMAPGAAGGSSAWASSPAGPDAPARGVRTSDLGGLGRVPAVPPSMPDVERAGTGGPDPATSTDLPVPGPEGTKRVAPPPTVGPAPAPPAPTPGGGQTPGKKEPKPKQPGKKEPKPKQPGKRGDGRPPAGGPKRGGGAPGGGSHQPEPRRGGGRPTVGPGAGKAGDNRPARTGGGTKGAKGGGPSGSTGQRGGQGPRGR